MKKLILIFIAALLLCNLFSLDKIYAQQSCLIDSIYILPEYPTEGDSLSIVCTATFYSGPAFIHSMDISVEGNNIKIFMKYFQGVAAVITTIKDTLKIGVYMKGEYNLIYNVENYLYFPGDTTFLGTCNDSLVFYVTSETNVDRYIAENSFSLYPNPAESELVIKSQMFSTDDISVEIYTMCGKRFFPSYNHNITNGSINIQVNELSSGVYYIRVLKNKKVIGVQKWIKYY